MGGLLLRRERNRTHITELGKLVRPHLEQIYAANRSAREEAKGYRERSKAPLNLGVMCTIGPSRLIGFFDRLADEIPALEVATQEATGGELVEELMQGNLEIALIGLPDFPDRLDARSLFSERYADCVCKGSSIRGDGRGAARRARQGGLPVAHKLRVPGPFRRARSSQRVRGQHSLPERARGLDPGHDPCRPRVQRHGRVHAHAAGDRGPAHLRAGGDPHREPRDRMRPSLHPYRPARSSILPQTTTGPAGSALPHGRRFRPMSQKAISRRVAFAKTSASSSKRGSPASAAYRRSIWTISARATAW